MSNKLKGIEVSPRDRRVLGWGLGIVLLGALGAAGASSAVARENLRENFSRIGVPFVENRGQLAPQFAYSASTFSGSVVVAHDGALTYSVGRRRLTETFVAGGARPIAGPHAAASISFFLGNDPGRWQSDLPAYEEVRLGEVWPGIRVALRAHGGNVEKVFSLRPGARVGQIRLQLNGVGSLTIAGDGSLRADNVVRLTAPTAYQVRDGKQRAVPVSYVVHGSRYGFRLGSHDPALPVVIDPVLQSTYLGGAGNDSVNAIAVHPATGEVLVAGTTFSADLPGTLGGARGASGGGADGFIARFDPTLTRLLQVTYFGGSGGESILGLAIHPVSGDVYVAGFTSSEDLPGAAGAQPESGGTDDGFVARFDSSLTQLLRSTYLGGSNLDKIVAIAVHPSTSEIFVAGETSSADLPGTADGAQPAEAGDVDGFVARFDPTLMRLLQATYVGGGGPDYLHALAIDPRGGTVYVGGQTLSIPDFPATAGGANAAPPGGNGNFDAFIARLDPSLTRFVQSTLLGSAGAENVLGLAVHPSNGDVYAVGWTDYVDFPGTEGGAQPGQAGERDCFVARFDGALTTLAQATYLGGSGDDSCAAVIVHPMRGDIVVTGETFSTDLPGTAQGIQAASAGGGDGFVVRLDPALRRFFQATYLGASDDDTPSALAAHPVTGEVLVAGATLSPDFPAAAGAAQPAFAGGSVFGGDGFVSRLPAGLGASSSECVPDANTLCLNGGRFRVRVAWRVPSKGTSGVGTAVPLSEDTGYFWFFDSGNVELVLKVLDARALNQSFWVFYGALSDAGYTITVTDTDSGTVRTYENPAGTLASRADTSAFAGYSALAIVEASAAGPGQVAPRTSPVNPCGTGDVTLCLGAARFQVQVDWSAPRQGTSGHAVAVPLTDDTGYFWFFDDANVELVVKVLDGRPVNGHFWVFYGALSDVQYTVTVRDTVTGDVRTYSNASGHLASFADTSAF